MKQTIFLLCAIFLIGFQFCKSKKSTAASKEPAPKAAVVSCAATITFGSSGSGIDAKKYDEIKVMIEDRKLKYTEKPMGKEGERQICLPLTELSQADKSSFISKLKNAASSGQLVSVSST